MARLALLSFRDVLVTPYTDLLEGRIGGVEHRGGPRWPEWSAQTVARHCRAGAPVDDEPAEAQPKSILPGAVAWGGAITSHFGHQIAEFTTRLLPTLAEMPDVRFAYGVREDECGRYTSWEEAPASFRGILEWYGITGERVDLITAPTLVERLVVAPQAEQYLGPGPQAWYLDLLDAHTRRRLGEVERSGSLYVSRAGQHARFAGEEHFEDVLREAGFSVLRPEAVTIEEQLRAYAGAESIVFAGGSAIHGLQLMGRGRADVMVLRRWADQKPAPWPVEPRVRSLRYVDALRCLVHGLDITGEPAHYRALSVLDPEKLLPVLPLGGVWDQKAFDAAVEADVERWLEEERATRRWAVPGSAELLSENLRAAGL